MVPFGLRSLLHERVRLAISVGGVAFAILLILVLRGIMDGTIAKTTTYIDRSGADIFIARGGVQHMALIASSSLLPADTEDAARSAEGVDAAEGIIRFPTVVVIHGSEAPGDVIGFTPGAALGGPWRMTSGSAAALPADGVIVTDSMARSNGLADGDEITIAGRPFRVAGVAAGSSALGGGILFIRRDRAAELFGVPSIINFVLVRAAAGSDIDVVVRRLQSALPQHTVIRREQLAANDRSLLGGMFITPVNVMATVGLLVGLTVIALTTYSAAAERTTDFGVLKAIGARNRYLYGVILRQALMIAAAGFVLGLALAVAAAPLIEYITPELGVQFEQAFIVQMAGIALAMSLVAAVLPVRRLAGVDPKLVFRT
jgi:putative ABC transport system permease protein